MKSPSPPKRIAKFTVSCELGHRFYLENFMEKADAAAFVQAVVKEESLRWVTPEHATAKGGVLVIKADDLEDLIEMKKVTVLPPEMLRAVEAFLRGKWPQKEKASGKQSANYEHVDEPEPKAARRTVPASSANGMLVSLADMCQRNKWTPRAVRVKLRDSDIKKPGGGWAWPSNEAAKVETQLKELMS